MFTYENYFHLNRLKQCESVYLKEVVCSTLKFIATKSFDWFEKKMRFKTFGSLFLMIIDCFAVSSSQLHPTFFNFDQEVSEVFFGSNFSNFKSNSGQNDVKCASELSRLQQSLRRYEKWAIEGIFFNQIIIVEINAYRKD